MHSSTLFHLIPANQIAHEALLHPDNKRFVSSSSEGLGLEVGYHVSTLPRGHVITRLGRDADLILRHTTRQLPMSGVHVAFEINPATRLVRLSVRSKRLSSVSFSILDLSRKRKPTGESVPAQIITGDGVIMYAQNYTITIASYKFDLIWRTLTPSSLDVDEPLKAFVFQHYQESVQQMQRLRSRDRPTDSSDYSEAQSWHVTRLHTARPIFRDIPRLRRKLGQGTFGTVYRATDDASGNVFAIKVVDISEYPNIDEARALLHREIKVMERLKHDHIVEYLGHDLFDTLHPEIQMPLRDGNLTALAKSLPAGYDSDKLSDVFLEHILSALDYLANQNVIHRDLKPDNILYSRLNGNRLQFQLADFGLAHYDSLAKTLCGTGHYQAPELYPHISGVSASQSSKLDIWSLYASALAVHSRFREFPPNTMHYNVVLDTVRAQVRKFPRLEPMTRLHPECRASAAQMLLLLYDGRGLTTPRSSIPPIPSDMRIAATTNSSRNGRSQNQPQRKAGGKPLIVYEPQRYSRSSRMGDANSAHRGQRSPMRSQRDGVVKHKGQTSSRGRPLRGSKVSLGQAQSYGSTTELEYQFSRMVVE